MREYHIKVADRGLADPAAIVIDIHIRSETIDDVYSKLVYRHIRLAEVREIADEETDGEEDDDRDEGDNRGDTDDNPQGE